MVKREYKGNSLTELSDSYVVIDIETTGLDSEYDEVIELGAIRVVNGAVTDEFQSLVMPVEPLDDFIINLTGITNDMLSTAPTLEKILPKFLSFIGDFIIVGHNVNFDINFIYDKSILLGYYLKNDFIDTLRFSRKIFKDFDNHRLSYLKEQLDIPIDENHRTISDCYATYNLFNKIKEYINDNHIDTLDLFKKKKGTAFSFKDIKPTTEIFDESHPIYGKLCVFTGTLCKFSRKEAMQAVINLGGKINNNVTKDTNYLILGVTDYRKVKNGKSSKYLKAEKYILEGFDLRIISENVFYDMIE